MQYDSYREKVKKVAGVLGKMYAHRLVIFIALVALTLTATVLVMTKGLLVTESDCPSEVVYGDKLGFRAGFVVSVTHYEYREQGSDTWTEEKPVFPGRYQVRAYGKTASGARTYTDTYDFTIIPREITLTVTDTTVEYGDSPRIKVKNLARGDKATCGVAFTDYGSPTTVAYPNLSTLKITDKKGNDRTAGYTVRATERATVHFKPRPLTVTVQNASKVYDDTALSYDGYEITRGSLLAGDNLVAVFRDTLVDAGSKSNTPTLRIYNGSGTDVTGMYDITVKSGKLTVEKRPLIVETGSQSFVYTGYAQEYPFYTLDSTTSLVSGHRLEVRSAAGILDRGSAENVLTFGVVNGRGVEETHNYSIFVKAGTLTVTPREVTVHTQSGSRFYNGTDQSYTQATVENGVGDEYRAVNPTTRRDVGSTENRFAVEFYRGDKNITDNYIIKGYTYGTLTVTPRPITVQMAHATKVYDGTPLTAGHFEIAKGSAYGLVQGHTLALDATGSVVFGSVPHEYVQGSARITDGEGRDVTKNYTVTVNDGTLTVNPRPITVSSDNGNKIYDGTPLSGKGWGITQGSLLRNHQLSVSLAGTEITDVGKVPNAFLPELTRVTDLSNGEDVTEYYDITYDEGTLEVLGRPITVHTLSDQWMYDGETHEGSTQLLLTKGTLLAGHTMHNANSNPITIRNAGSVENRQEVRIFHDEWDVTHNYTVTYVYGTLTVTKRPIYVRTGSETLTYDGTPHALTNLILAPDSPHPLVYGHELCVRDTDRQLFTDAGSYVIDPRVSVYDKASGIYVTDNYAITCYQGVLIIEKRPLYIQINGEKIYDGLPMNKSDWWVDYLRGTSLAAGDSLSVDPEPLTSRNAGSYFSSVRSSSLSLLDASGKDVRENYDIGFHQGTLTIRRRPISVMTATAEKLYDGLPLTDYTVTVTPDSLPPVEGHTLSLAVYGSGTEVGQYPNSCYPHTFAVSDGGWDVTDNYELVEVVEGTLTVKHDVALTVTTGSASKPFDGLPLTSDEYTLEFTRGELPEGYAVYVDVGGIITRPGSAENSATVTVRDGDGNDVTALFTVNLRLGVLTVTDEWQDGAEFGRVWADADGVLYLRMTSYGGYNGKGWNPATPYKGTLTGGYSLSLLPAAALKNLGISGIQTARFSDMKIFMLPYYTDIGGSNPAVGSDTDYTATLRESYDVTYYPVDNTLYLLEQLGKVPSYLKPYLLGSYSSPELTYRSFVHGEYLTLDAETRAFMQEIIETQGFDASHATVIADVADYIRGAARYDLSYDPALDEESNVAVAFLRDYREGVCVHYATAATLLYRALGIPARYTTGFAVEVKAGEWTEIRSPGHAWVEVYVDGLGWVQVEVTGSADTPDIPDVPTDPPAVDKPELLLIPTFTHKVYDGAYLYARQQLVLTPSLEALLKLGYTYDVTVAGAQKEIGDGVSVVSSFVLYDPAGRDVTDSFRLVKQSGLLRVTAPAAEVLLYPLTKTYDGDPAVWGEGDYTVLSLPDGAVLTLTVTLPADSVGIVTLSELNREFSACVTYRVIKNGVDVTSQYPLVFTLPEGMEDVPVLTVRPRALELTAASETRVDDGSPLENPAVYITKGSLAAGHTLLAAAEGTQSGVGSCDNTVGAVTVLDANGEDVTALYTVTCVKGTLTLLAEE